MKITITAQMKGENEVMLRIAAAFQGAENNSGASQAAARDSFQHSFADAINAGFKWNAGSMCYDATCQATPEACSPFAAYANDKNLEIIQL